MKQYEEVFFSLLRAGLWGGTPYVPDGFGQWREVASLAKSQSVLGLVGNVMLEDGNISSCLPQGFKDKLRKFLMSNIYTHTMLNNALVKVVGELRQAGIPSVLLKGQGLAVNYPRPELRQCGDIDLYVGKHGEEAYEVLKKFATKIDEPYLVNVGKHYHVSIGSVEVEVHRYTNILVSARLDNIYQAASDKAVTEGIVPLDFNGTAVYIPEPDFNAFFIFDHFFKHFLTSGIGLRQVCDWVLFLHEYKDSIDRVYLEKLLADMELMLPWKAFGCVAVDLLGLPRDEMPFYDPAQKKRVGPIVKRIFAEGNFGKERSVYKNRGTNYLLNKTRSFFAHIIKTGQLLFIFPVPALNQFRNTLSGGFRAVWADIFKR